MNTSADRPGLLVHNASEIATMTGGVRRGPTQAGIGLLGPESRVDAAAGGGPAIAAYEGRIFAVGRLAEGEATLAEHGISEDAVDRLDAGRGTVTPGLVDPHTHLLFAGTRHAEVEMRQRGHTYLEILAAGGGILQTVRMTRAATDDDLLAHGRRWLSEMLAHGVTTTEAKSGYGLDTESELRLLALLARLGAEGPVEIVPTFLGAHAVGPEFRDRDDSVEAYVEHVITEQLPAVVAQGVATSCDVFCERGVFDVGHSMRLLEAARDAGLAARLHADQIHASGGAELAASIGALSADHLAAVTQEGIDALARAAAGDSPTIATLLPLTSFYLADERDAPARF